MCGMVVVTSSYCSLICDFRPGKSVQERSAAINASTRSDSVILVGILGREVVVLVVGDNHQNISDAAYAYTFHIF